MAFYNPLFVSATPPISGGPVFDPFQIPIFGGPISIDPTTGGVNMGGGAPPIFGFSPPQSGNLPAPMPVPGMPVPITGHCLLRHRRRINWANPRALTRANRRLHSFVKHARKYVKITRRVKSPRRRRK